MYLQEYQRTTDELDKLRGGSEPCEFCYCYYVVTLRTIMLIQSFGRVLCYWGGLCYVKDPQPTGVWITSFAMLGGNLDLVQVCDNNGRTDMQPCAAPTVRLVCHHVKLENFSVLKASILPEGLAIFLAYLNYYNAMTVL